MKGLAVAGRYALGVQAPFPVRILSVRIQTYGTLSMLQMIVFLLTNLLQVISRIKLTTMTYAVFNAVDLLLNLRIIFNFIIVSHKFIINLLINEAYNEYNTMNSFEHGRPYATEPFMRGRTKMSVRRRFAPIFLPSKNTSDAMLCNSLHSASASQINSNCLGFENVCSQFPKSVI